MHIILYHYLLKDFKIKLETRWDNWKCAAFCLLLNLAASVLICFLVYDVLKNHCDVFYVCIIPIMFGLYCFYICFSPLSLSSNYLITSSINRFNSLLNGLNQKFEHHCKMEKDLSSSYLDSGFKLMNTVIYVEKTFGKILCVEFLESYITLVFSTFFQTAVVYQVLRAEMETTNSQHQR